MMQSMNKKQAFAQLLREHNCGNNVPIISSMSAAVPALGLLLFRY